jgi:hypothetical protein
MKTFIGIGEVPVHVKVVMDTGTPVVVEVRDRRNGMDVHQYLERETLERLAQDGLHNNEGEAEVIF